MILALCMLLAGALLPPIGGIVPPAGTILVTMDITPDRTGRPKPDVYGIASPLPVPAFRAAYADAARRAGYETSSSARIVVGMLPKRGRFRLVLQPRDGATAGVLTVRRVGKGLI
jgi:hypothetical protein